MLSRSKCECSLESDAKQGICVDGWLKAAVCLAGDSQKSRWFASPLHHAATPPPPSLSVVLRRLELLSLSDEPYGGGGRRGQNREYGQATWNGQQMLIGCTFPSINDFEPCHLRDDNDNEMGMIGSEGSKEISWFWHSPPWVQSRGE